VQIIWAIIGGAIAGFIARWISPSPNNPQGFVLTTLLGIVGSVVATFWAVPSTCTVPIKVPASSPLSSVL
jgi:uncharacterized membrane protein YeaQ/YmgE (transglycosylase-associated protein family)